MNIRRMQVIAFERFRNRKVSILLLLLALSLGLRIWNFPPRYHVRDGDEVGYLSGGLLLWEGITPGFKMSPAGPLTWMGWAYCAALSAQKFFLPDVNECKPPWVLRPFMATERALFETYRDMTSLRIIVLWVTIFISLWGIWAAFQLGYFRAGPPGGLITGGLMAVLPVFVAFSGMARPYMMAWSWAAIAHYYAVTQDARRRMLGTAIFMGLSISSRLEMLTYFPILIWEFWHRREPESLRLIIAKLCGIAAITALLTSPWLMTNLMGNLRTIATVRFFGPRIVDTWVDALRTLFWSEGLGPASLLTLLGFSLWPRETRGRVWLLGLFLFLLLLSALKPTFYGIHHQGPVLVAMITSASLALQYIRRFFSRAMYILTIGTLLLPLGQTINGIVLTNNTYAAEEATVWVEYNVPPGTTVYLHPTFHDPLPTQETADAIWAEVTNESAGEKKFKQGLERFNIATTFIPRALSEENLIQERGNRRRWFLLGGQYEVTAPRYNIKLYSGGSPFDIPKDKVADEYKKTEGVLIWRGSPIEGLGRPVVSWISDNGLGTYIYYSSKNER